LLRALERRLARQDPPPALGLLLVQCRALERLDALEGVDAGDALADSIAAALRKNVLRQTDALLRIARDQFACVLEPLASEGVAILAAEKVLRTLNRPLPFGELALAAEPCVGVALSPQHAGQAGALLQCAMGALQAARAERRALALFSAAAPGAVVHASRYAARLRHAIENNELELHYQPQLGLQDQRIASAEALLRWNDAVLGPVPPNTAVAAAEAGGLMNELTFWVIGAAVRQCAEFRAISPGFKTSINISPSDLRQGDLVQFVDCTLRTWGLPGSGVILEITETAMLTDQKTALDTLEALKRLGVGIAIDDFGTGYSSMYYLAQMPLDELKIDVMFVRRMLELPAHAKIVRSLIDLAHNLELSVVAEGVEDEAVAAALAHLGCDRAQGWFVGKAMPADQLAAQMRSAAAASQNTQRALKESAL
jgi:predicted signal transduction protein with EAL and GGDEF domain